MLRIANCSGFYGDRLSAAREMVEGGAIDVLTGDYLAELTMAILHKTLPNLLAINFVIKGLLGDGVSSSTRSDPQAKSLGEYLRARVLDVPEALLA